MQPVTPAHQGPTTRSKTRGGSSSLVFPAPENKKKKKKVSTPPSASASVTTSTPAVKGTKVTFNPSLEVDSGEEEPVKSLTPLLEEQESDLTLLFGEEHHQLTNSSIEEKPVNWENLTGRHYKSCFNNTSFNNTSFNNSLDESSRSKHQLTMATDGQIKAIAEGVMKVCLKDQRMGSALSAFRALKKFDNKGLSFREHLKLVNALVKRKKVQTDDQVECLLETIDSDLLAWIINGDDEEDANLDKNFGDVSKYFLTLFPDRHTKKQKKAILRDFHQLDKESSVEFLDCFEEKARLLNFPMADDDYYEMIVQTFTHPKVREQMRLFIGNPSSDMAHFKEMVRLHSSEIERRSRSSTPYPYHDPRSKSNEGQAGSNASSSSKGHDNKVGFTDRSRSKSNDRNQLDKGKDRGRSHSLQTVLQ